MIILADYKRMVSYMYQYENGVKRKNVGYARVEARNGLCKITLHMQLLGQLDSIFPTYLIQRDDKNMELIYLGDTLLRNQVMDSKLSANETNIMDTGYNLSDMGGMLLFLNDTIFFATEWDDKPINVKDVLEALKPKKEPEQSRVSAESNKSLKEQEIFKKTGSLDKLALSEMFEETEIADKVEAAEDVKVVDDLVIAVIPEVTEVPKVAEVLEVEVVKESIEATEQIMEAEAIDSSKVDEENSSIPLSLEEELQIPKYKLPRGWKTVERLYYDQQNNLFEVQGNKGGNEVTYTEQSGYQENADENNSGNAEENSSEYLDRNSSEDLDGYNNENVNNSYDEFLDGVFDGHLEQYLGGDLEGNEENNLEVNQENNQIYSQEGFQVEDQEVSLEYYPEGNPDDKEGNNITGNFEDSTNSYNNFEDNNSAQDQQNWEYENNIDQEGMLSKEDIGGHEEHPTAKQFFDHYPRIYPFEDNEIMFCVKIEPGDIGLLPKETWVLSSNSFLMHGFYCYHHLIFAKMKSRYGCQYILGIPGIYHNRESFMARMFGFESFKSIRKRELKQGDFGYWYLPINF